MDPKNIYFVNGLKRAIAVAIFGAIVIPTFMFFPKIINNNIQFLALIAIAGVISGLIGFKVAKI